jgi:hypothetical protein
LDAESLRDAYLSVSGELDLRIGGPYTPVKADAEGQIIVDESAEGSKRRSLYLQQRRTQPVAMLQVFDGPAHNPVCVQRVASTVALQSLAQLNSDFVRARSRAFARRVLQERKIDGESPESARQEGVLNRAFELAWGRPPTDSERTPAERFLVQQGAVYDGQADAREKVWTDFCQLLLAGNQFLYVE